MAEIVELVDPRELTANDEKAAEQFRALVGRAITGLASRAMVGSKRYYGVPLWSVVGDAFCCGGTRATQLCTAFGFDPDLKVRKQG